MLLASLPNSLSPALASALCTPTPANGSACELPPLWMMIVAQLEVLQFEFTPQQIAKLFHVVPEDVRKNCRALWPAQEGQWSLEFDQAAVVIYRMARGCRKLDPAVLIADLHRRGLTGDMVREHPNVARAQKAILVDRDRRTGRGK